MAACLYLSEQLHSDLQFTSLLQWLRQSVLMLHSFSLCVFKINQHLCGTAVRSCSEIIVPSLAS